MTHTFRATPAALQQATIRTIIRFATYEAIFAAVFVYILYLQEWQVTTQLLQVVAIVFGVSSVIFALVLWRSRQRVKTLEITIDEWEFRAQFGTVKVSFNLDEIRKVGVSKKGFISIYLKNGRLPFIMLSPHIEKKELLLKILEERAPVEPEKYSAAAYVRLLTLLLTLGAAITLAVTQDFRVGIPAGVVLLALIGWAAYNIYANRKRVRSFGTIITLLLLAAIVILKLVALSGRVNF